MRKIVSTTVVGAGSKSARLLPAATTWRRPLTAPALKRANSPAVAKNSEKEVDAELAAEAAMADKQFSVRVRRRRHVCAQHGAVPTPS